ncbi:ATP phosphoribosyltransferase, partial [Methylomagnum sp.]
MLTLALPKGRIYDEAVALLGRIGIEPTVDPGKSRKLIVPTNRDDFQLLIIRASDVPTYVEYGAADLGVAGKDVLVEYDATGLYEPLDLGIARCRLMTAGKPGMTIQRGGRLRVATKYEKTAHRYFASRGIQAEIIKLYGSMELAPLVGLADCIV